MGKRSNKDKLLATIIKLDENDVDIIGKMAEIILAAREKTGGKA